MIVAVIADHICRPKRLSALGTSIRGWSI